MVLLTAIILGFILDFIFGDPRWLPHPICFIGRLISITEKAVRRFCGEKPEGLLMGGFVLVVIVLTVTFAVPYFILTLAEMYSPVLAFAVETFMFYQIFAMRSLKEASLQVYDALKSGDLQEARKKLSWIVGRDTAELTDEEVANQCGKGGQRKVCADPAEKRPRDLICKSAYGRFDKNGLRKVTHTQFRRLFT